MLKVAQGLRNFIRGCQGAKHLKLEIANLISPHFPDEETSQNLQTHMNYLKRTQVYQAGRRIRDRDGVMRLLEEPKRVLPPGSRGSDFVGRVGPMLRAADRESST